MDTRDLYRTLTSIGIWGTSDALGMGGAGGVGLGRGNAGTERENDEVSNESNANNWVVNERRDFYDAAFYVIMTSAVLRLCRFSHQRPLEPA